jgi:hypothetical protein
MAKKSRTPPPPRRPQGPKQRSGPKPAAAADSNRSRMLLYGFAAAGVIGLVVAILLITLGGGGTSTASAATTLKDAGCTFKTYKELPRSPHYQTLTPKTPPKWNSFPPTSGRHYVQPVIFGQYEEPVEEIQAVHNLEHGGVVIQYGSKVPRSTVDELTSFYQDDANALLLAPLPALGNKISLTAWTHLATCTSFDEKAFKAFRDEYRYHGPEHFPPSALEPGE